MKEYKYTINGTKYEVAVGDIEENIVTVTVNGETYKVEIEKEAEPEKKKPVLGKPAAAAAENASATNPPPTRLPSTRTTPSRLPCPVLSPTSRLPLAMR